MNKKMMFCVALAAHLLVVASTEAATDAKQLFLIPQPQQVEIIKLQGLSADELRFITPADGRTIPVLGTILDALPQLEESSGKGVRLEYTEIDTPDSPEGYRLLITKEGVRILSRGDAGLFYGCQTLEQLLENCRKNRTKLPFLKITDYPDLDYRAAHFDTKHHLAPAEYYYRMIDRLSRYKINAVIWEIEDKLRFTRRSEIGAPNALSKQEVESICRYARDRHIQISPLIQGLGHASFILKHHWELRETLSSDWEFCPSDPRTYELQFDLYRDALEAMPYGKYLHIGGDEIGGIGIDQRCKATGKSAFELQMEWLQKVCDFAVSQGRIPIFWDDMPLKYANLWWLLHRNVSDEVVEKEWDTQLLDKAVSLFPKECIYMRWHYDDPTILPNRKVLAWYAQKGLKVMAATAASMGETPFMPRQGSRSQYIKDFSMLVKENNLVGILATAWDDGSAHWETVARGFIAQGEFAWNPTARTAEEFLSAHAEREFGLNRRQMEWLDELEKSAFFFDGALITSGSRNPAWGVSRDFTLINLPHKDNKGEWTIRYQSKIDSAQSENSRLKRVFEQLLYARQKALRNRYTLEVYEQTARLFDFPNRLLLALQTYDRASNPSDELQAKEQLRQLCRSFSDLRHDLESVYSQTRFMAAPEGYIADMNHHHHLSAMTLNSDWLYLYELSMLQKVEEWLNP